MITFTRLRLTLLVVALVTGGLFAGLLVANDALDPHAHAAPLPAGEKYQCPMHPQVVQDHPGTCPICNMKLVKVPLDSARDERKSSSAGDDRKASAKEERKPLFYRSPMDARQTSPVPMKDPMGMDYVPVYENPGASSEVDGLATVELDANRQQLIGLKTAPVTRGVVGGELRTAARIGVDETRVRKVNVKVSGFVEKIYADFVGKPVKKGQPLFSLYSPDILAAENEYLLAQRTGGGVLLDAAKKKLELWGLPAAELARLDSEKVANSVVTFTSHVAGVVTKKEIVEGSRVELGAMPYEVVDLSTVWVLADVYETELRFVVPGMTAALRLDAFPGRTWQGKVLFIDPMLDPQSRTAKVRLAFSNPQGELRPEMFGDVTLAREGRETLRLPTDAIVQSGTQSVVFVSRGEGRFEPRVIVTGERGREFTEVISGLSEGEQVITRANFLIDSESRLRASLARIAGTEAHR